MVSNSIKLLLLAALLSLTTAFIVTGTAEGTLDKPDVDLEFVLTETAKEASKALSKIESRKQDFQKAFKSVEGEVEFTSVDLEVVVEDGRVTGYKATVEAEVDTKAAEFAKVVELGSKFGTLSNVEYEIDEVLLLVNSRLPKERLRLSSLRRLSRMLRIRLRNTLRRPV